jgi:hypothetical protein
MVCLGPLLQHPDFRILLLANNRFHNIVEHLGCSCRLWPCRSEGALKSAEREENPPTNAFMKTIIGKEKDTKIRVLKKWTQTDHMLSLANKLRQDQEVLL